MMVSLRKSPHPGDCTQLRRRRSMSHQNNMKSCVRIVLLALVVFAADVQAKKIKGGGRGSSYPKNSYPKQQQQYPQQPAYNPSFNQPKAPSYPSYSQPKSHGGGVFGGGGYGKPPSKGIGGLGIGRTGTAVLAGGAGALGGLYLGHKLGQFTSGLSHNYGYHNMGDYYRNPYMGYYGYYDERRMFQRCPPPQVVSINGSLFVPYDQNANYDGRCQYFERMPPQYYVGAGYLTMANMPMVVLSFVVCMLASFRWPRIVG